VNVEERRYKVNASKGDLESVRAELLQEVQKELDQSPLQAAKILLVLAGYDPKKASPLAFRLHSPEIVEAAPAEQYEQGQQMARDEAYSVACSRWGLPFAEEKRAEIDKQVAAGTLKVRKASKEELAELDQRIARKKERPEIDDQMLEKVLDLY
jgi:hypothetical protein